jgi:hypothetical protein
VDSAPSLYAANALVRRSRGAMLWIHHPASEAMLDDTRGAPVPKERGGRWQDTTR